MSPETSRSEELPNEFERAPFDYEYDSLEEIGDPGAALQVEGRIRVGDFVIQKHPWDSEKIQIAHKRYKGNTAREEHEQ